MNKQDTKGCVELVRAYLAEIGKPITQSQGYEVVARCAGLKNKHVLAAETKKQVVTPAVKKADTDGPADIFKLGQKPYTIIEMMALNWSFDVVIPMPVDCLGDIELKNDTASEMITGSYGLQDICYEVYDHFYDNDTVAIRVTGYVTDPEDVHHFYADEPSTFVDDALVAEWVGVHYQQDFDHSNDEQKEAWRVRYVEAHVPQ